MWGLAHITVLTYIIFLLVPMWSQSDREACLDSLSHLMGHLNSWGAQWGTTFAPHPFPSVSAKQQNAKCIRSGLFGIPSSLLPTGNKVTKLYKQRHRHAPQPIHTMNGWEATHSICMQSFKPIASVSVKVTPKDRPGCKMVRVREGRHFVRTVSEALACMPTRMWFSISALSQQAHDKSGWPCLGVQCTHLMFHLLLLVPYAAALSVVDVKVLD